MIESDNSFARNMKLEREYANKLVNVGTVV